MRVRGVKLLLPLAMFLNFKSFPWFILVLVVGCPLLEICSLHKFKAIFKPLSLDKDRIKRYLSSFLFSNVRNFPGEMKRSWFAVGYFLCLYHRGTQRTFLPSVFHKVSILKHLWIKKTSLQIQTSYPKKAFS